MARILSIPDVHGSHKWEVVKSISQEQYDYIVFHGDYFDSRKNEWPDQGENFKAICEFVRKDTIHRKLLIGNHDFSYLTRTINGTHVSGHQEKYSTEIENLLKQNLDIIDLAFECDGWVFSHAGFSKTWIKSIKKFFHTLFAERVGDGGKNSSFVWNEEEFSIGFLNHQWHKVDFSDKEDELGCSFDELLDWHGLFSGCGDEVTQGPLWIRPESLLKDAFYPKQVVGHTEFCLYEKNYICQNENKVIFVDSSLHEVFEIFDTSAEYSFLTLVEYYKWFKKTRKIINDIKSQIIYHKDKEKFIQESLKSHFSEKVAEKVLTDHPESAIIDHVRRGTQREAIAN